MNWSILACLLACLLRWDETNICVIVVVDIECETNLGVRQAFAFFVSSTSRRAVCTTFGRPRSAIELCVELEIVEGRSFCVLHFWEFDADVAQPVLQVNFFLSFYAISFITSCCFVPSRRNLTFHAQQFSGVAHVAFATGLVSGYAQLGTARARSGVLDFDWPSPPF